MNYLEAVGYLDGFVNFERKSLNRDARIAITLDRVRELAARLDNPQDRFASLHVAGTKGKGSTCAFAAAMLAAAGLKVGLYTSPHLQDLRERIRVNGTLIPEADFARILTACVPALQAMRRPPAGQRRPTYFEVLTHLAFTWFAEQHVDVAAVETGLGGRLDATNIITPLACGITNISYDHMAILGDTLELIAREKAGIFKPGVPAVVAPQIPSVTAALRACARETGAPVECVDIELPLRVLPVETDSAEWPLPRAELRLPDGRIYAAELGLHGVFQTQNWAVAVRLADLCHLKIRGRHLPQEAVAHGARRVYWPGRLEDVTVPPGLPRRSEAKAGPRVFLDGAHNDLSVQLVLQELRAGLPQCRPLVVLFGCAKDKDTPAMLKLLADPVAGADEVVFTQSGHPRSHATADLAREWAAHSTRPAATHDSCAEGLAAARRLAGAGGVVLVTGSLYLVGAVKDALMRP